jgi:hypothetical protein
MITRIKNWIYCFLWGCNDFTTPTWYKLKIYGNCGANIDIYYIYQKIKICKKCGKHILLEEIDRFDKPPKRYKQYLR